MRRARWRAPGGAPPGRPACGSTRSAADARLRHDGLVHPDRHVLAERPRAAMVQGAPELADAELARDLVRRLLAQEHVGLLEREPAVHPGAQDAVANARRVDLHLALD